MVNNDTQKEIGANQKILIVSAYAPPAPSGSGLMMWHLLSRFPQDSLAILTSEATPHADEKYRLSAPYYYYSTPLTSLQFNGRVDTISQRIRRIAKNFPPTHFIGQIFYAIRIIQRVYYTGRKAMQCEQPTILLGYSDMGPALIGTYLLSKKYKTPYSLFFYDLYVGNKFPLIFRLLARFFEAKLLRDAEHIFVMCDNLHDTYKSRSGRTDITVIYNSTDRPVIPPAYNPPLQPTITYLGNIYWAQLDGLRDIVKALPLILQKPKLRLFTPHSKQYLKEIGITESDMISFHTCAPEDVSEVLNESSLNIATLSLDTKYQKLINTSSPGRLCEYLRADAPILVHASKESFLVQYMETNNAAHISTTNDPKKIAEAISKALNIDNQMIQNAHNLSRKNHDPIKNADLFYKTLCL